MIKKKVLLLTYLFLAIFCTISVSLYTVWMNSISLKALGQNDLFEANWNVTINNTAYKNISLSTLNIPDLPKNSTVVLENILPDLPSIQPSLWLQIVYSVIEVTVNNKVLYSYGLEMNANNVNIGSGYHIIPLSEDLKGQPIRISLTTTQKNAFSSFKPVLIKPAAQMIPSFLQRSALSFSSSVFLILLGAIGTIVCLGALFLKKKIYSLLALSQFSFWVGMGVLANTDLLQLFSQNLTVNSYIEYGALYATALSLVTFFYLVIVRTKIEKIITSIPFALYVVFCTGAIILERMSIIHLPQTLSYYFILCGILIFVTVSIAVFNIIKKQRRILFSSLSYVFLLFFCAMDISRYIIQKNLFPTISIFYSSLLTIGVIIFMVSELLFYFISLEADTSGLSSLSNQKFIPAQYTFLASRKKLIQTVNELNKHQVYYTFISISFTNVPNEEEAFKHYGNTITSLLKTVFDCYGIISYFENNNFVIVVSEINETKLHQLIKTFNQLLEYKTLKESFPEVKTSIGYAFSYESSYKSFKAVFSLAQQRKRRSLLIS